MNKDTLVKLTIDSTPEVLLPAMVTQLTHLYKVDPEFAVEQLATYFKGMLSQFGYECVLSNVISPLFDVDDIQKGSLTYMFEQRHVNPAVLQDIRNGVYGQEITE